MAPQWNVGAKGSGSHDVWAAGNGLVMAGGGEGAVGDPGNSSAGVYAVSGGSEMAGGGAGVIGVRTGYTK